MRFSRPGMHPWEQLDEDLKQGNRAQADGLADRLAAFGYRIEPLTDWAVADFRFADEEIQGMARMEHQRWRAERRRQGWKHGAERDDDRKLPPDLVSWEELSTEAREGPRHGPRPPGLSGEGGFQVERGDR